MNDNTLKLIEALAAKLGTTSEYLWSVLLHQSIIYGIKMILLVIASLVAVPFLMRAWNKYEWDMDEILPPRLFIGILLVVCVVITIACTMNAITALLNPEFWALQFILDAL